MTNFVESVRHRDGKGTWKFESSTEHFFKNPFFPAPIIRPVLTDPNLVNGWWWLAVPEYLIPPFSAKILYTVAHK
jgi:hypothetical protein